MALSFSRLDFVIVFGRFCSSLLVCCRWIRFSRVYMILIVVLLLLFILFPDGFLLCDHGLDFFRSAYMRIQSNSIMRPRDADILANPVHLKDQGEGSPKQACSYWFARSRWLATVARTSILLGTWPMLYCLSLALSVSCLVLSLFLFFFVAPYWFAVAEFAFFEYIW